MSSSQPWREIRLEGTLMFSAPIELPRTAARGLDTQFGEWHGDDILVRVDAGLFADPLTRYGNERNVRTFEASIDGQAARGVTFDQADGSRFTGVHFPDLRGVAGGARKTTFVVITSGDRTEDDAMRIVRSIRFQR